MSDSWFEGVGLTESPFADEVEAPAEAWPAETVGLPLSWPEEGDGTHGEPPFTAEAWTPWAPAEAWSLEAEAPGFGQAVEEAPAAPDAYAEPVTHQEAERWEAVFELATAEEPEAPWAATEQEVFEGEALAGEFQEETEGEVEGEGESEAGEREGLLTHASEEALARLEPLAAEAEALGPDEEGPAGRSWTDRLLEHSVLVAAIAAGQRSESVLTDRLFRLRHPEYKDKPIARGDEAARSEWRQIRDRQVVPMLLTGPFVGPMHGSLATTPAGTDLRKGVPEGAVLSPLSITRRGLRRAPTRQPGTIAAIVVHNTSRGPANKSREVGYRRPAIEYALDHYLNGKEGFPHYVVDFNGTIYATCDERLVAWHAGWVHAGGVKLFRSGWTAPEWWSRVWSRHGAASPIDLLPKGAKSPNYRTIGIELLLLPNMSYTPQQYKALARLVVEIQRRNPDLQIPQAPSRALLGHEDFAPVTAEGGRADAHGGWDPGAHRDRPFFDWQRLWSEIQALGGKGTEAPESLEAEAEAESREEAGEELEDQDEWDQIVMGKEPEGSSGRAAFERAVWGPLGEPAGDLARDMLAYADGHVGAVGGTAGGGRSTTVSPFSTKMYPTELAPSITHNARLNSALQTVRSSLSTASDKKALGEAAIFVARLTPSGPMEYAAVREHDMLFSGSLLKISLLYASFELEARVNALAPHITAGSAADFLNKVKSDFNPKIVGAIPKIPPGPWREVSFDKALDATANASGTFSVKMSPLHDQQLRRIFRNQRQNQAAKGCMRRLGFSYVNGSLDAAGFFGTVTETGIWMATDYIPDRPAQAGNWPSFHVPVATGGTSSAACTCVSVANLLTRIHRKELIDANASRSMRDIFRTGGSWLSVPNAGGPYSFTATGAKVGHSGSSSANVGPVKSEAAYLKRTSDSAPFIAVWQNVPDTFAFKQVYKVIDEVIKTWA